ncbi:MAG: flagellar filament capping protein FliD [Verrucomicrobium sp.]|nr:flagellar filament capping protein FliD [Verrucomicrobium sp.]
MASGFDWRSLVDKLSDVERTPQKRLRAEQSTLQNRNNAFGSIKTQLNVLKNRVAALSSNEVLQARKATVSDSTVLTANAAPGSASGTFEFNITQLATASKTVGASGIGANLYPSNNVSSGTLASKGFNPPITAGTFTVDGAQITTDPSVDTLQDVFDRIDAASQNKIQGSYSAVDDKISLRRVGGPQPTLVIGSATDTSNFLSVARLANNGTNQIDSATSLGSITPTATLNAANFQTAISDGGAGAGEFKINGVSISFNASADSVQNLMDRINASSAGVTISYDRINDQFTLTNKVTGNLGVAVEDVTGNFLEAAGLITGANFQAGKDLLFSINNGPQLSSHSNTLTSEATGIDGLSINVLKTGTSTVSLASDSSTIKGAIKSFIDDYNRAQSTIDSLTSSSTDSAGKVTRSTLAGDTDANEIASKLRGIAFNQATGLSGVLNSLAKIGIDTTGDNDLLNLEDETALDAAIANNLSGLKTLFNDPTNGIATKLSAYLDNTIGEDGTLIARQDALTKQSSEIDTQVTDLEKRVQANRQRLIDSFVQMETAQQSLNQQLKFLQQRFPAQ